MIRNEGSQRALICDADTPVEEALERVRAYRLPTDSVSRVSCKKKWYARTPNPRYSVVAVDCGIKLNIVRKLNQFGCNVTVVPYDTPADTILSFKPDGLFLSNGPGDPEDVRPVIDLVRALRGRLPIFGICLGHQIARAPCGSVFSGSPCSGCNRRRSCIRRRACGCAIRPSPARRTPALPR